MHDFTVSGNVTRTSASPGVVGISYSSLTSASPSSYNIATPPPIGFGRYASVRVKQEDESEDEDEGETRMETPRGKDSDITMDDSWDGEMEMEMD